MAVNISTLTTEPAAARLPMQYDPRPRDIVTVHRRSALCEAVGGTLHSGKCGNLKQEGRPEHQTGEGGAYPPHQRLDIRAHGRQRLAVLRQR